jgi:hypothetical protein
MKTRRLRLKTIKRSHNPEKKFDAVFVRSDGSTITQPFGQKGYNDFIVYNTKYDSKTAKDHKRRYIARHRGMGETFTDPTKAQTLSRYVLWNKKTLKASIRDFKRRFNL